MQNKGALKLLAIVIAIACAYQLSFTLVTQNVERKAKKYANGDPVKEMNYLDSMKSETVYNLGFIKFNYKQCKQEEINLGLDLRGGMNVMLEISVEDVVKALSNNSTDPTFNQALTDAKVAQRNSTKDYITLFKEAYEKLDPNAHLSLIFNTPELREIVLPTSTNAEVIEVLRQQSEGAIANSFNVLRNRIDRFGVTQPNIQRLENSGRILVELPGVKDPERVRKLLQGTASLEFWATYSNIEILPLLEQVDVLLADMKALNGEVVIDEQVVVTDSITVADSTQVVVKDSVDILSELGVETAKTGENEQTGTGIDEAKHPLFAKLHPMVSREGMTAEGPIVGQALSYDTAVINSYLRMSQVKAMLPRDVKLMWGVKAIDEAETVFQLYAIKANTRDGMAPLDGGAVVEARGEYSDRGSSSEVDMTMNAEGARKWARLTADNVGNSIAIVLDGYVYSAPNVSNEITGGKSQITGDFTLEEARDLANVLKSGKLPAPARIIQDTVVGPSLGQESIDSGFMSFILAFLLVLIYMWFFYNTAGLIANLALVANLFFLFGVLAAFKAVLTLPGIAGIVLTMGMAVDANVIIYERIKEELRAGKALGQSIADGFGNALSAIIDGNITTLITGIVLFIFGTGPVQGFATTLIIGIITSLFCAIFIPRLIFAARAEKGKKVKFSNKFTENFLTNSKIDFIKMRKITYIISAVLLLITCVSLATRGMQYGVDFSGGRAYVVRFDQDVTAEQIRPALNKAFGTAGIEVKQFGEANQMRILTQYKYDDDAEGVSTEIGVMLYNTLKPFYKDQSISETAFTTNQNPNGIVSSDKVGPSVAHDIKINSIIAVLFSLIAIGLYIVLRFGKWQWAMGGVVSLLHDAILTIGIFSLLHGLLPFNLEVDQSFIAAILTIIGYSINDTVVIFDRIREYGKLYPKRTLKENINNAINSTMARTINTAGTTFVVLLSIFLFGGEVIRGFIFALMFGVFIGTFSSIFVATPFAYDCMKRKMRGETAEK